MSLEAVIQENTKALTEHTALLRELLLKPLGIATPAMKAEAAAEATKAIDNAKAEAIKEADTAKKTTAAATEAAATAQPTAEAGEGAAPETKAEPSEAKQVSYTDAAAAVTTLARTKGKAAAVGVLAKFGAANLKEVKPEDFAAVIAACNEA